MNEGFTGDDLAEIVKLGGRALEVEDRFICGCLRRNSAYRGSKQPAGIVYLKNERYYQRVIVGALLASFGYVVKPEYPRGGNSFDFALVSAVGGDAVALGELKLCMDKPLGPISEIVGDIEKLRTESCGQFVLLCYLAEKSQLEACINDLLRELGCSGNKRYTYAFDTEYDRDGKGTIEQNGEFALIGVLLKESAA
jgi:hypothetical protein